MRKLASILLFFIALAAHGQRPITIGAPAASGGTGIAVPTEFPALPPPPGNPAGVTAPGSSYTLAASGSSATGSPLISEYTRTASPDEHILLSGENLSSSLDWLVFRPGVGVQPATIATTDNQKAAILLPQSLGSWDMYVIWAKNSTGYSSPVTINQTESWWMEDKVVAGTTASAYGRNLARGNVDGVSNSYVFIRPSGATTGGQFVAVTDVTPYRVQYTVPALSVGTYTAWLHNGHGGDYGWSEPMSFSIVSAQDHVLTRNWGTTTSITTTTAVAGDAGKDNSPAINSVQNALFNSGGGTVLIPAGTWYLKTPLDDYPNVRIMGAVDASGVPTSILKIRSDFVPTDQGLRGYFANNPMTLLENLTIDNTSNGATHNGGNLLFRNNGVTMRGFRNVVINAPFQQPFNFSTSNNQYIYIENCDITGQQTFFIQPKQLRIRGTTFRMTRDADAAIQTWSGRGVEVTNCIARDQDTTISNATSHGIGRIILGQAQQGATWNGYYANNYGFGLGPVPTATDYNKGENFLWEGQLTRFGGLAQSATATTVTFATAPTSDQAGAGESMLMIVSGRGVGQTRRITANNTGTATLTVDRAFRVTPDNTSLIMVGWFCEKQVVYRNRTDAGNKKYIAAGAAHNATTGVNFYGGTSNCVFENNEVVGMRTGMSNFITQETNPAWVDANHFNVFRGNLIRGALKGVLVYSEPKTPTNTLPASGILGSLYSRNRIENSIRNDIEYEANRQLSYAIPYIDLTVYEHSRLSSYVRNYSQVLFGLLPLPLNPDAAKRSIFYKLN